MLERRRAGALDAQLTEAASNMADRATLTRLGDSPSVMEKGSQELEDSLAVERKKVRPSPAVHS